MLEGAVAVPYSDELLDLLEETCLVYKSDDEYERVDELVIGFVTGVIPVEFRRYIGNAISEHEFQEVPTDDVLIRLAQYVVLDTILNNTDDEVRAICASKLMNYMLVAKALKRNIPNSDSLLEVYNYHLSRYLKELDTVDGKIQSDICNEIPNVDFPYEIPEEAADDVRLVFKQAELYRIEQILTSTEIQNILNPFERVYVGLCKMFEHLSYCFYNLDLNRIICLLIGDKDDKKRRKLSKIIGELVQSGCVFKNNCSETSVILKMVNGEAQVPMEDLMLPVKEFAVYLYYELLTDKIIATRN